MTEQHAVVRWRRPGRRYSLWHLPVAVPSDDRGQTACGRRYPRRYAETGDIADGALCRNCLRALRGAEPGIPAT
jgi:hypothetical protein